MTYEDLIKSIKKCVTENGRFDSGVWLVHYLGIKENKHNATLQAALEIARVAYEAAIKEVQDFHNCEGCMAQEQGYARGYKEAKKECADCVLPDDEYGEAYDKGYEKGCEVTARNSNAWYVEDRNGEPIRLGDKVKTSEGILTVTRISGDIEPMECLVIASDDNGGWQFKPWKIEKVKHDTEEIIIDDLADAFGDKGDSGYREEAKQFYDRIAAQVTQEIEADVQKRVMGDAK